MAKPLLSVHRETEAIKEAVVLNAIEACAIWLQERGYPDLARDLLADMVEPLDLRDGPK